MTAATPTLRNRISWAAIARVLFGAFTDLALLGGLALVAFGVHEAYRPAGIIVAGAEIAALGWLLGRGHRWA